MLVCAWQSQKLEIIYMRKTINNWAKAVAKYGTNRVSFASLYHYLVFVFCSGVDKQGGFYQLSSRFLPGFILSQKWLKQSVNLIFIPTIHTTGNNKEQFISLTYY